MTSKRFYLHSESAQTGTHLLCGLLSNIASTLLVFND